MRVRVRARIRFKVKVRVSVTFRVRTRVMVFTFSTCKLPSKSIHHTVNHKEMDATNLLVNEIDINRSHINTTAISYYDPMSDPRRN